MKEQFFNPEQERDIISAGYQALDLESPDIDASFKQLDRTQESLDQKIEINRQFLAHVLDAVIEAVGQTNAPPSAKTLLHIVREQKSLYLKPQRTPTDININRLVQRCVYEYISLQNILKQTLHSDPDLRQTLEALARNNYLATDPSANLKSVTDRQFLPTDLKYQAVRGPFSINIIIDLEDARQYHLLGKTTLGTASSIYSSHSPTLYRGIPISIISNSPTDHSTHAHETEHQIQKFTQQIATDLCLESMSSQTVGFARQLQKIKSSFSSSKDRTKSTLKNLLKKLQGQGATDRKLAATAAQTMSLLEQSPPSENSEQFLSTMSNPNKYKERKQNAILEDYKKEILSFFVENLEPMRICGQVLGNYDFPTRKRESLKSDLKDLTKWYGTQNDAEFTTDDFREIIGEAIVCIFSLETFGYSKPQIANLLRNEPINQWKSIYWYQHKHRQPILTNHGLTEEDFQRKKEESAKSFRSS